MHHLHFAQQHPQFSSQLVGTLHNVFQASKGDFVKTFQKKKKKKILDVFFLGMGFGGFKRQKGCNKTLDVCVCAGRNNLSFYLHLLMKTDCCCLRLICSSKSLKTSKCFEKIRLNPFLSWKFNIPTLHEKLPHSLPERRTALLSNSSSFSLFYFGTGRS